MLDARNGPVQPEKVRRSALHEVAVAQGALFAIQNGWQIVRAYDHFEQELGAVSDGAGLADVSDWVRVIVEGQGIGAPAVIEQAFGLIGQPRLTGARAGDLSVYRLRQDQYLVLRPFGGEKQLVALLEETAAAAGRLVTVTNITDGQACLLLVGPAAAAVLGHLCALDLDERVFPEGSVAVTSLAKTRQLIARRDVAGRPAYLLSGGRSYAVYLWEALLAAGQEHGLRPIGSDTLQRLSQLTDE